VEKKSKQAKRLSRQKDEPSKPRLSQGELALISEKAKKFDPKATKESCIADLRRVQDLNPFKVISRNFYRHHGKYSDSTWNQWAGTFHEFKRQAKLELTRDQHAFERKIAKHASLDHYRNFYKEEILPWHGKYTQTRSEKGRFRQIAVISDLHDEELDQFVFGAFLDVCKNRQPNLIVLNGDLFDNPEFSKYQIDPRTFDIKKRFNFVHDKILAPLRLACPNAQIDFIIGNHDWRIIKVLADKTPHIRTLLSDVMGLSLADVFGLKQFEINLIAKVDLSAFRNTDIKEELNENFQIYYDRFACSHFKNLKLGVSGTSGHTHHPHQNTFASLPMGKMTWTTTGCAAQTRMEYTDGMDDAVNSFLFVTIDTDKIQDSVSPEHHIITGDHVMIDGKIYTRK